MSRKVYVEVTTKLLVRMDDGVEVSEVINDMDYAFTSQTNGAHIEDTEVLDYNVTDSK